MECLGFQLGYLIRFVSRFFFSPSCYSWRFLVCGRSVTWIQSVTTKLVSESAASAYCRCSFWKAVDQVGGPSCPSGAPLMSACLSMGLRDHMHKAACKRRISSINGSGHKFWEWLSFLFNNTVKTFEKWGVQFLPLGLFSGLGAVFVWLCFFKDPVLVSVLSQWKWVSKLPLIFNNKNIQDAFLHALMSLRTCLFFLRVIWMFETTGFHWLFFVIIFGTIRWNNTAQSFSNRPAQEPKPVLGIKIWKSIGDR